jgi:hypothetical protein
MSRALSARRRILALLVAAAAAIAIVPAGASAATGSYTLSNWTWQPQLYNKYLFSIGPTLSPPAGIPSNAVVTGVSGYTTWNQNAPSGFHWEHDVCFGNTSTCVIFVSSSGNSWSIAQTSLPAGFPTIDASTTSVIYAAHVTDGNSNPTSYPAINPPLYITPTHALTIYYSY